MSSSWCACTSEPETVSDGLALVNLTCYTLAVLVELKNNTCKSKRRCGTAHQTACQTVCRTTCRYMSSAWHVKCREGWSRAAARTVCQTICQTGCQTDYCSGVANAAAMLWLRSILQLHVRLSVRLSGRMSDEQDCQMRQQSCGSAPRYSCMSDRLSDNISDQCAKKSSNAAAAIHSKAPCTAYHQP